MTDEHNSNAARNGFLYWWPVTARVLGSTGGFATIGYALVTHQTPDPASLAFFGALIAAPSIFDTQDRRNTGREGQREP